ncbi:hypothetical protein [Simkania negevensis]|nr:hypothetical protein [Simkania negevensis]MCB1067459.1 hypothetical protein [Simkania sp.]MCB1074337.1 hypothetical protein [Simkania sp.]MCP5490292.1 hypothetical protein [Chlamydiales bacterium]
MKSRFIAILLLVLPIFAFAEGDNENSDTNDEERESYYDSHGNEVVFPDEWPADLEIPPSIESGEARPGLW